MKRFYLPLYFTVLLPLLIFQLYANADFPQTISINQGRQTAPLDIPGNLEVNISVSFSMSGTIKLINPIGEVERSISFSNYTPGGFITQINMNQVGTYTIDESYKLTASSALLGMSHESYGTRSMTYNNSKSGLKNVKIASSSVGGFSVSLPPGNVSVLSITPSSVEPGESVSVRVKVKEGGIPAGGVIADSVSVSAIWNVSALEITDVSTTPPGDDPPIAFNLRIETIDATTGQKPVPYRSPRTGDRLRAGYDFNDPNGDPEKNSKLIWYRNNTKFKEVIVQGPDDLILPQTVYRDETWYFSIIPSDGVSYGNPENSGSVKVTNAPPKATGLSIQPASPFSGTELKAVYTFSDPENDPEGATEIRWYKNNKLEIKYNDQKTIPGSAVNRGDKWYFELFPKDNLGATSELGPFISPTVTVVNQKPTVKITSVTGNPGSAPNSLSGKLTITYDLIDADGDLCSIKVAYRIGTSAFPIIAQNVRGIVTNIAPGNGLTVVWESDLDQPAKYGDYRIVIQANDGLDAGPDAESNKFLLDNNEAPKVSNVFISPKTPFSSDDLKAEYKFEDPNPGDAESGSRIRWYKNKAEQTSYRDKKVVSSKDTKRDEEWYFTIEPSDGKEFGKLEQSTIVKIKNSPPVATDVKLLPEHATSEDDLKASYKYSDSDGDPEKGTEIRWYLNGELKPEFNDTPMVPSSETVKGQEWFFTVLVKDGTDTGKLVESNHVKVGNKPPLIRSLIVPEDGYKDVKITFELVDSDGDKCSLNVEYRGGMASNWTKATIKEPLSDISPGQITLTWQSDKDQNVREATMFQIRITPNDGTVSGEPVESTFIKLDNNIPPIASNLRILPENPKTTDNLTAEYDFFDEDGGQDLGSEIRWFKNGVKTDLTGKVLSASSTSKGEKWSFSVRPRDGSKWGEVVTSEPVTILNSPPIVKNVEVLTTTTKTGDVLVVKYDFRDADDDKEVGTELEWYKNGALQLKQTVSSQDDKKLSTPLKKGEKWHVVVRPKDGSDFGQEVKSNEITILNSRPSVDNIIVNGQSGDITISFSLIDPDDDLCDLKVEYSGGTAKTGWAKATIVEPTAKVKPSDAIKLTWRSKADEPGSKDNFRIRVTANDGTADSDTAVSAVFAVNNNTPPSASKLAILPETPNTTDDLQAYYVFSDADRDKEEKPEIRWYKNGQHELIYNDYKVLPARATTKGDRWYFTIKVFDGKDYDKLQMSPSVTIANAPPIAKDVKLIPDYPKLGDKLTAAYVYSDPDEDAEFGTKIEWYLNGVHQPTYDNLMSIPGHAIKNGEEWYFVVTPMDGSTFGMPQASNKVYIGNLPPTANSLKILPANPLTTDDLVASYIYIDPNNDPESGSRITWYKNNVPQTQFNDMLKIPSSETARNQVWYFTVMPKDGKQFGDIRQSNVVIIGNTPPKAENPRITPAYPMKNDDLVANYDFIDVDGDLETRSEIKWYRNGTWVPKFDGLKVIPSKELQDRDIWYFTVRPKDDKDFGELVTSDSVEVGSPIPRVNNLVIKPDNPLTSDDLIAYYEYVDPYGIPESGSIITWYKDGVAQTEYNNLKVLPSSATAKGEQWYFTVKPKNGTLFGKEQRSVPVTIGNSPPKLIGVAPQPANPTTDDDLTADYVFQDPDNDKEVKSEIQWFRNNVLQPEFDGKTTIPASATNRNEIWHFVVRASDGTTFSDFVTSSAVKIGNGKPKVTDVSITPLNPTAADNLTLKYKFLDTENDPESGTEINWFKDGIQQDEYHNLTSIPSSALHRDQRWYCTVRPRDGMDFGPEVTSPIVVIQNSIPKAIDITAQSNEVLRGGSVTIKAYGEDLDPIDTGPNLKCKLEYKVGSDQWAELTPIFSESPIPHFESVFKPGAKAVLGDYDFRVKFFDPTGAVSNTIEKNALVKVLNSPPTINPSCDNFRVPEDTVREFDLSPYGYDLEDGTNLTWRIDPASVNKEMFNASISMGKILEIRPVDDVNGQHDITLIATDSDGTSVEKRDVTVIIDPINDKPTAPTIVRITPENPLTSDTLICTASGSTDLDGDSVVYRYQWYKNGIIQEDLKVKDVPHDRTSKGDIWKCEVTPSDGKSDGPSASAQVVIGNTKPAISNIKVDGVSNLIKVTFDLEDLDGDNCSIKVEFKTNTGTWNPATVLGQTINIKPQKSLTLSWDSNKDAPKMAIKDCRLRLTPNDGTLPGEGKESEIFTIDNKPPTFTITTVSNPVFESYVDVNVASDEALIENAPSVTTVAGGKEEIALQLKSIGTNMWKGTLRLEPGFEGDVLIHVKGTDLAGNVTESTVTTKFSIPGPMPKPKEFALLQNYPNPVHNDTKIPFRLAESCNVTIKIYNSLGILVKTIDEGYKVAGFYEGPDKAVHWDGKDESGNHVAPGIYFYHLIAGDFEKVKKMIVIR